MEKYLYHSTEYINIHEEEKLHNEALKIVLQRKIKLEKLYTKPNETIMEDFPSLMRRNSIRKKKSQFGNINSLNTIMEDEGNPYEDYQNFLDEKTIISEKNNNFAELRGIRPIKDRFSRKNLSPIERNKENIIVIKSMYKFNKCGKSLSPKKDGIRFFITDEFLNNSIQNQNEKKIEFLPKIKDINDSICSKIMNKSKNEKEKLSFWDLKSNNLNNNLLTYVKDQIITHTGKEINIYDNQNKLFKKEFNDLVNTK